MQRQYAFASGAALVLLLSVAPTRAQAPMTLEQAMALAKPESFGTAVFSSWWSADGRQLVYQQLPAGTHAPATYSFAPADGSTRALDAGAAARVDPEETSVDATGRRVVFARDGVVLRDLPDGEGQHLTNDSQDRDPRFSVDGKQVFFRRGADWWAVPASDNVAAKPLLQLRVEPPPPTDRSAANDTGAAVYLDPQVVVLNSWLSPCPSSDDLRQLSGLLNGGSGSLRFEVMQLALGAASGGWRWSGA